jgi:hypothetical protein
MRGLENGADLVGVGHSIARQLEHRGTYVRCEVAGNCWWYVYNILQIGNLRDDSLR